MPSLYTQYKTSVVPELVRELGLTSTMQVPRVKKVVLNVGYGRHAKDKQYIDMVENTLRAVTGQQPVHNKAKKSISNFKTREGMDIGMSVTLRGPQMYEFLYRLINITLPRVRDFRGLTTKAFDAQGNYAIGFKENTAFPELGVESADKIHPLQVIVSTSASSKNEGLLLLKKMGFPFN